MLPCTKPGSWWSSKRERTKRVNARKLRGCRVADDTKQPGDESRSSPKNPLADFEYTAFEKWDYHNVFYVAQSEKSWLSVSDSFYQASKALVDGAVNGHLFEEIEGIAAVFLFRHYLELGLKRIILNGRWLKNQNQNAPPEEVAELKRTHRLKQLWDSVLADAKPKMPEADWNNYDTEFVQKCILEFESADPKSEAFRYSREGAERCHIDFRQLLQNMEHVHQVLEGIDTYLVETYGQNADWQAYLESEYLSSI